MAISKESKARNLAGVLQSERGQMYAATFFNLILAIFLIVAVIRPTFTTIVRVRSEIREKENIESQLVNKIETINRLSKQYTSLNQEITTFNLIYANNNDYSLLLMNANQLGARNGLTLQSASFRGERDDELFTSLNVLEKVTASLSYQGDINQLPGLLEDLEEMPMYPVVEEITYNNEAVEGTNYLVAIQLSFYSLSAPEQR